MENVFLGNTARLVLPFISLVLGLATLILFLDCIWRSDRRLRKSLIFFAIGMFAIIVRKVLLIMGFNENPLWYFFAQYVDIGLIAWFFLAALQMYKMIRVIDHEKK